MIVEKGKLFCSECREIISSKKSVLKIHISSKKHQNGKEKLKKSKLKDQTIIEAFRREGSQKIARCTWKNVPTDSKLSVGF